MVAQRLEPGSVYRGFQRGAQVDLCVPRCSLSGRGAGVGVIVGRAAGETLEGGATLRCGGAGVLRRADSVLADAAAWFVQIVRRNSRPGLQRVVDQFRTAMPVVGAGTVGRGGDGSYLLEGGPFGD